ncbi:SRPBCC family protein [Paenibacillus sp. FJAT-26967]|uniref:SRPBCC family protein n=1 Tax=Paenibacillus sp. FJAT-26967 TaxID=1729690 RepID=UPI000838FF53|nr:SRPBCC family protein [Paenibacillus sp. FJAT-26967]
MPAYAYHFETNWKFNADIREVWELIGGTADNNWWSGVSSEPIHMSSDPNGIGSKYNYVFRTKLPYKLAFIAEVIRREEPQYLEIKASGELEGQGAWRLAQEGSVAHVQYIWQVNPNKRWMNLLGPILRPVFIWNHSRVMNDGAKGIASTLGVKLISY